ncbi:MAG TPA: TraI domain-containing protein [Candidatus Aphodousia faecigallinarum]|uniref:TraI domain-containing protein n=1 Tax=Candidatus Aphodousia faecigallinarum TaxID=2840677 RepID=A0A9D1LFM9_9BURK|nr:TraI domain-containing protein [Candidatus Aphodousia faecigallinarum]
MIDLKFWSKKGKSKAKVAALQLADVFGKSECQLSTCANEKQTNVFNSRSFEFLLQQHRESIKRLCNALPLSESKLDELILPILEKLIRLVHLLPASASHHHSYPGGLIVHSLQCAEIAVEIGSYEIKFDAKTPEDKYLNRDKWILACCLVGLLHDSGKVFDLKVTDQQGQMWNPNTLTLLDWIEQNNVDNYLVHWLPERQHKAHQLRSIRVSLIHLLPTNVINYLSEDGDTQILTAIEDAIVLDAGPLAYVLKRADSGSIRQDMNAKVRGEVFLKPEIPPVGDFVINTIRHLIEKDVPPTSLRSSIVSITKEAIFLNLTDDVVKEIHYQSIIDGCGFIPTTASGLVKVLSEIGALKPSKMDDKTLTTESYFWKFDNLKEQKSKNKKTEAIICLIKSHPLISQISLNGLEKNDEAAISQLKTCSSETKLDVVNAFKVSKNKEVSSKVKPLTNQEITGVLSEPMPDDKLKEFLSRLIETLLVHSRNHGSLAPDIVVEKGKRIFSSIPLEQLLKNYRIQPNVVKIFLKLKRPGIRIELDVKGHQVLIEEIYEENKRNSGLLGSES